MRAKVSIRVFGTDAELEKLIGQSVMSELNKPVYLRAPYGPGLVKFKVQSYVHNATRAENEAYVDLESVDD